MVYEKNPKGKKCIKLKIDMEKIKNIKTIDDFFNISGLTPYLQKGTIYDVRQIFINEKTGNLILNSWQKNWKKCKELKGYKEKYALSRISFTWMNYSPVYNDKVLEGYLYIYPKKKPIEGK